MKKGSAGAVWGVLMIVGGILLAGKGIMFFDLPRYFPGTYPVEKRIDITAALAVSKRIYARLPCNFLHGNKQHPRLNCDNTDEKIPIKHESPAFLIVL